MNDTMITNIADIVYQAYGCGLMQHETMTLAGITLEMTIYTHFNQLTARYGTRLISTSVWDSDSAEAQLTTVYDLIAATVR